MMTTPALTGVLLMAYGGPDSLDDIPAFVLNIRGGRPIPPALIAAITENYRQIGGKSPLLALTQQQADHLEAKLNDEAPPNQNYRVYVGMRHWTPWIKDTVGQMIADGIQHAIALVLAPHYSGMSTARYFAQLDEALAAHTCPFTYVPVMSYHDHPHFVAALAQNIRHSLVEMPPNTLVIFSAHSLPVRIIAQGDPYDDQLRETAQLVATQVGLSDERWTFSYQSAGHSPEPWLGPQLEEYVVTLAEQGHQHLLVCPVGFVVDHVEVLFDVDIEAKQATEAAGARLERVPALNTNPLYIAALTDLVRQHERIDS